MKIVICATVVVVFFGILAATGFDRAAARPAVCTIGTSYAMDATCQCPDLTHKVIFQTTQSYGLVQWSFSCQRDTATGGHFGYGSYAGYGNVIAIRDMGPLTRLDRNWVLQLQLGDRSVINLSMSEEQARQLSVSLRRGPTDDGRPPK